MIFSIVGAALSTVAALCCVTWYTGGEALTLFGNPIISFTEGKDVNQAMTVLLSNLVILTTEAILLGFAGNYFKTEQAEGTPFSENGANLLKKLGIRCIYMPIVAAVIASVITVCFKGEETGDISNLPSVATGIVLILVSMIFRYGAELEKRAKE